MESIEAVVEGIIYRNEDNGYTVAEISVGDEMSTAVGNVPQLSEGMQVELQGQWVSHPSYGLQFKIEVLSVRSPDTIEGITRYLASGIVPGVGPVTAGRIVDVFGAETLEVIRNSPEKLADVQGISARKAREIAEGFAQHYDMQSAMVFLQSLGLTTGSATKIYKTYGSQTETVLRANPYRLVDDIEGVGFKTADRIAQRLGVQEDSIARAKAGLLHVLKEAAAQNGHTLLPQNLLYSEATNLLGQGAKVEEALMRLAVEGRVNVEKVEEDVWVYLPLFRYAERDTARRLAQLADELPQVPWTELDDMIERIARNNGIELAEEQHQAVEAALRYGLTVITGGPGTGKTTAINCIISALEAAGLEVALAAPTGRAAKRMTEATGREARTIHRLLEYMVGPDGEGAFKRDEDNPLEAGAVIIDEMSMVDILLMQKLLRAVLPGTRLILVGDSDQLPSVGPGNVLKDIINSTIGKVVRLQKIFRQAEQSLIVTNAHRVNSGEMPELGRTDADFFFERKNDVQSALSATIALVSRRIPGFGNYDPIRDIQVLTPMKRGDLGVYSLNDKLRETFNPSAPHKPELKYGELLFRQGDKVMQIKNNYSIKWRKGQDQYFEEEGEGVFNGDMGVISSVQPSARTLEITFDDGRTAIYDYTQLEELQLAYAVSIHKSQGSEFPVVVLPLVAGPPMLMTRNLLYTAITRAREMVVICGNEGQVRRMVENNTVVRRYSGLLQCFRMIEEGETI